MPASPQDLSHLTAPGIRAFTRITQAWGLTVEEQMDLLGVESQAVYTSWQSAQDAPLSRDQMERLSHVLGIYASVHLLLPDAQADAWAKKPNEALPFEGRPALDLMRQGTRGLALVRAYLQAQVEGSGFSRS